MLKRLFIVVLVALAFGGTARAGLDTNSAVFIILMENHVWADIKGSASAPYINNVVLPMAASAEQYYNNPGIHPSLPNYLWLESGTGFGIFNDNAPGSNHQGTTNHFVTQLKNAGISWRAYEEDMSGGTCPLSDNYPYAVRHCPFVYFDDVTATNNSSSVYCITNVRPFTQLAGDLTSNKVARYNFITPNVCDDMHDSSGCSSTDSVRNGDNWLSNNLPRLLQSAAYTNGGAVFITWDEGENSTDGPIGMIALSPFAKRGYTNSVAYTHSSTLRTMQKIFGVRPFLNDATNATDLSDLFVPGAIPGADYFAMDGAADSPVYTLRSATNMYIWAAVRSQTLYIATWSPGNYPTNNAKNDHFVIVSDQVLPSASQQAFPAWAKSGFNAVATNKPYLAGESANSFVGWFNAPQGSRAAKWGDSSQVMEGAIDLVAAFGSGIMTGTIYIAAAAYVTTNGGALASQGPAAVTADGNIDSNEFLALSVASLTNYTSSHVAMTLAGTFNAWNPALSNMQLAGDGIWQVDAVVTNEASAQFKFAADGAWVPVNWGDSDQAQFSVPFSGTGDPLGSNITVSNILNGTVRFTFNDLTLAYSVLAIDSVGDGIPDAWRARYFGGNGATTNSTSCATCDADSDGVNNWNEYVADTCPTNSQSRLRISGVDFGAGTVQVGWMGGTSVVQRIEYRNLGDTNVVWTPMYATNPPTVSSNAIQLITTNAAGMFRIKAER